ncbi:hypothetical protein Tco_0031353 [Tanacetum coccineum]
MIRLRLMGKGRKSGNSDEVKENGDIESMNDGRMDESRCEIQVEQVCGGEDKVCEFDEMVNKRDKGCLDSGSNRTESDKERSVGINEDVDRDNMSNDGSGDKCKNLNDIKHNNGSTYAKMVTKDLKIVDNKLSFVPTEINEEGGEIVIFDEALVDKGSAKWKLTICG